MLVGPNNKKLGPAFWMSLGIFSPVFSSNTFYFILQEYLSAMDRGKQNKTKQNRSQARSILSRCFHERGAGRLGR